MTYKERLLQAKQYYPFSDWEKSAEHGLDQYTTENCDAAKAILDDLIVELEALGENASEEQKIKLFEKAVKSLNQLDEDLDHCLIETGEREQLCELFNQVAIQANIDPKKYGSGEGPASEWRDW